MTLEPGDADYPDHGSHDYGPHSEQAELSGSVTLVCGAVVRSLVSLGSGGRQDVSVVVNNTEIEKKLTLISQDELKVSPLETFLVLQESLDHRLVTPLLRCHVVNLLLHLPDLSQSNLNIFTWNTKYL